MISHWFKKLKIEDAHPAEETLLACADGELSDREAAHVRRHLENCWTCRARLDEIQETITQFVNFRNQIQNPLAAPPPNNWSSFDRRLAQLAAENEKVSLPSRLGFWQRFRQSLDFAEWSPARKQFGIGAVAAVLIVALLWQTIGVGSVSAAELLDNSIRAESQKTGKIEQPVVYQKLRLSRAGGGDAEKSIDWETWHDRANSRYAQALADERAGGRRFINAALTPEQTDSPDASVLREVFGILQANRMNPRQPLSAKSFRAWRDSLANKSDEIENSRSPVTGAAAFILKTGAGDAGEIGQIVEARLTVRANDWHAETLRFSVKTAGGATSEYEFVETAYEVVKLPALSPEIFPPDAPQPAKTEIVAASPNAAASPAVSPSAALVTGGNLEANVQPPSPITLPDSTAAATAELEVEVLRLLNGIGADIGEETTVSRGAAGELLVQGVVESRQRKTEILGALAPVTGQPGLKIRIETSLEAQKRIAREQILATKNKTASQTGEAVSAVQSLEIRDRIPADDEVRRYLRSKGTPETSLNDEVNRFAVKTINRSNQVLLRAFALKNLASRFSDAQLRSMKPEARNQWLDLIAARAGEIENQNAALRQELGALFGGIAAGGGQTDAADEAGLKRAVIRLSELAAANDRAVRAAFAFSAGASADAVKGAQFRQSLGSVEALAGSVQSAARKLQTK